MQFEPKTVYYAECAKTGFRIIKHAPLSRSPEYAAWHPKLGYLAFRLSSAKAAAMVCRENLGKVNGQ